MRGLPGFPPVPPGRDLPLVRAAAADRRGRGVPVLPVRRPDRPGLRKQARAARPRPVPSPAGRPPLDALVGYGQARGWAPDTLRQAWRAVTAVLASRAELGEPPWDAAGSGSS